MSRRRVDEDPSLAERMAEQQADTSASKKAAAPDTWSALIDGVAWERDLKTRQFTFVSQHAEQLLGYRARRWVTELTF
ncbi:MAG: hypothetical protein JSV80_09845 [Acidobacteriota bacterium]|nr:MAG: hypothetical protein JSV80_09845 [Acidobacteriota bacterium]